MAVTPPPNASLMQQVFAAMLDQVAKYGLATVLAIALVGLLVWERVVTDAKQADLLGTIIAGQQSDRQSTAETQRILAEVTAGQARTATAQAETTRALERIGERLERLERARP